MRIPPYWAKGSHRDVDSNGKTKTFEAWGWSFENVTEAKVLGLKRARKSAEFVRSGKEPRIYDYLENPLREEIVESIRHNNVETAVITRNRYGALVLNSPSVCFVDVDLPAIKPSSLLDAIFLQLFAGRRQSRVESLQEAMVQKTKEWFRRHPSRSSRLYQTAKGLRLIFTDSLYDPTSGEVADLFHELDSDPLYRKLTVKQECFRARLTPKPWRCQCNVPPNRYPWDDQEEESKYRAWQKEYEARIKEFGICRFLESLGGSTAPDPINLVIDLHDRYTCRDVRMKLA